VELTYKSSSRLTKRFWAIVLILVVGMGALVFQLRYLYEYGSERDQAVDVYDLFRKSAKILRKRYALVRNSSVPWSVRSKSVMRMSSDAIGMLEYLYTELSRDKSLKATTFINEVADLISDEKKYKVQLEDHMILASTVAKEQMHIAEHIGHAQKAAQSHDLRNHGSVPKAEIWLSDSMQLITTRPIKPSMWSQMKSPPIDENKCRGPKCKPYREFASSLRSIDNEMNALKNKAQISSSRRALVEKERKVYQKLFALSDGVAGVLMMRESKFPEWRYLIGAAIIFTLSVLASLGWFVRGQRKQLDRTISSIDEALTSGDDATVPSELLPLVAKVRNLQAQRITTICVEDRDIEEWFRSVLRYNNEIRRSVIGLRDGIVWQKINNLEPSNDDLAHVLRQLDAQQELFVVLDSCISLLESGKISRSNVREIIRVLRQVQRFYGDVLPGMLKYASSSFQRAEHRLGETVRIMNLLIRAYDNLREKLPEQIHSVVEDRINKQKEEDNKDNNILEDDVVD